MAVKNKKKFSLGRRRTKFELSLGLTPAACWLFYYIVNPRLRKSKGEWTYLNITHLSRRKGAPCRRALQYAVNVLDAAQEPLGVKIRAYQHNGKPCHLIFCDITWNQAIESDQEPLFFTSEGHSRNLKYRCHSNKVLQQPHCADIAPLSNSSSLSNERSSSLSAFAENFQSTDSALPHRKEENLNQPTKKSESPPSPQDFSWKETKITTRKRKLTAFLMTEFEGNMTGNGVAIDRGILKHMLSQSVGHGLEKQRILDEAFEAYCLASRISKTSPKPVDFGLVAHFFRRKLGLSSPKNQKLKQLPLWWTEFHDIRDHLRKYQTRYPAVVLGYYRVLECMGGVDAVLYLYRRLSDEEFSTLREILKAYPDKTVKKL